MSADPAAALDPSHTVSACLRLRSNIEETADSYSIPLDAPDLPDGLRLIHRCGAVCFAGAVELAFLGGEADPAAVLRALLDITDHYNAGWLAFDPHQAGLAALETEEFELWEDSYSSATEAVYRRVRSWLVRGRAKVRRRGGPACCACSEDQLRLIADDWSLLRDDLCQDIDFDLPEITLGVNAMRRELRDYARLRGPALPQPPAVGIWGPRSAPVVLGGPGGRVLVNGQSVPPVNAVVYVAMMALAEAGPEGLEPKELKALLQMCPRNCLRKIKDKSPWFQVLHFPGKNGGRYRLAWPS